MCIYSEKELMTLEALYKQEIFTESEIKKLIGINRFDELINNNIFTIHIINKTKAYSLNKKGLEVLGQPYKKIYAEEFEKTKYIPNVNDIDLFKAISFCGLITLENQTKYFKNSNLDRCILANYIVITKKNNIDILELTYKSRGFLKDLNYNYFRKNTGIKYANYLFCNYLNMSNLTKRSYFLPYYNFIQITNIFNFLLNKTYIILDIESISNSQLTDKKIIEIGAIKISNGIIVDKFQYIIKNNNNYIPKHITKLTGITPQMLHKGTPLSKVIPEFLNFIENLPILAHGIENDWHSFILNILYKLNLPIPQNILIDTYNIATSLNKDEKNGLDSLILKYNLDISKLERHRAINDSIITYKILTELINNNTKKHK